MNKKLGREPMLNPALSTSQVFNTRELKMMKSEVAQKTWDSCPDRNPASSGGPASRPLPGPRSAAAVRTTRLPLPGHCVTVLTGAQPTPKCCQDSSVTFAQRASSRKPSGITVIQNACLPWNSQTASPLGPRSQYPSQTEEPSQCPPGAPRGL